jgi:hypothetical protein
VAFDGPLPRRRPSNRPRIASNRRPSNRIASDSLIAPRQAAP